MSNNSFFSFKNINFYSLCKDLLHGWWIIFIAGCVGLMITYTAIRESYEPEYTSTGIYIVTPKQSTGYVYTNKRFAESVVNVFQNLMDTDIMKKRLVQQMHKIRVNETIAVELIPETNLMKITSTSQDPITAFETIGTIMDNYDELSEYLNSDAVFDTLKAPVVPTHSDNALMPRNKSVKVGMISAFLMALLLAMISIFRKTIKTEAAIEERLDTVLLGMVYHENKNRTIRAKIVQTVKALLITSPIISTRFIDSINNIRIKMEYERERHTRRNVFLITSVCENEGKSTMALNVALSLVKEGKKVIIIDADMRKPAMYKMLSIPKERVTDVMRLLKGECGLDEVMYTEPSMGIRMVMSTKGHANTHEYIRSGAMRELVNKCSEMADYVIVDTPPMALVSDAEALLDRVDFAILVIRQDFSYERDILNSINLINDSKAKMLGCVLNDYRELGVNKKYSTDMFHQVEGKAVEIYGGE